MSRNVALGELFDVRSSKRVLKSQWKTEGVPFYRGREITRLANDGFVSNELFISENDYAEYAAKYGVPGPGDIVVTAIGTIGNSYVVQDGDRFYFKDASVLWLKRRTAARSDFVNLWLKSRHFLNQLDEGNGATVDTLTIGKLRSVRISLPPLPEQERIVAILDEVFAAIETATANAEKSLASIQELFRCYLNSVFAFRQRAWDERDLNDICIFSSGGTPSKKSSAYWSGDIPWVSGRDMKSTKLSDSSLHVSKQAVDESSTRMAHPGSLLILVRGMGLAHGAQIAELVVPCAFNQDIKCISPRDAINPRYLLFALRTRIDLSDHVLSNAAHGTLKIDMEALKYVKIPVPSMDEQHQLVSQIDNLSVLFNRVENLFRTKLSSLAELKRSILHRAFAGELTADAKAADHRVPEAGL